MSFTEYKDYYAILGVNKTEDIKQIKKKFRQLALKYHPDRNQGNKAAEAKFKEISEAYDVLSDRDKRAKYDRFGQFWQHNSAREYSNSYQTSTANNTSNTTSEVDFNSSDFSQYGNFDEFINELLGRFSSPSSNNSASSNTRDNTPPRSGNSQGFNQTHVSTNLESPTQLRLTFAEAFHGTTRHIYLNQETVEVRIPAGARSDSRIRLAGKGKPSLVDSANEDLYLNVILEPHSFFSFEGDNLVCEVPIAPDEAVLGASIKVPTPDGQVSVKIPAGINSSQVLRLRGKGWSSPQGDRTDLLVRIAVVTPQEISPLEKDYYEKIRNLRSENPRSAIENISI